jgi:hypothetical protein
MSEHDFKPSIYGIPIMVMESLPPDAWFLGDGYLLNRLGRTRELVKEMQAYQHTRREAGKGDCQMTEKYILELLTLIHEGEQQFIQQYEALLKAQPMIVPDGRSLFDQEM